MHSHFTALYDACVLYPATLRNVLMQLATTGLFRAHWTDAIHDEWTASLLRDKPDIDPTALRRMRRLMNAAAPDCLVTGYEPLIEGLRLPDPSDRHVLAAAIRCSAAVIVTSNLRDFPDEALHPLGVQAQHPDDFIMHLHDLDAPTVCRAIAAVRARLRNPAHTPDSLLNLLHSQGLPLTAARLRESIELL